MYYFAFGALSLLANLAKAVQTPAVATAELYSNNAVCKQNNCVNPIFPGLNDLGRLETLEWQCGTKSLVRDYLGFCKGAIHYDPALPSPSNSSKLVSEIVQAQDAAAETMFFFHLSGMGYEAWEHPKPAFEEDTCVKHVWEMVCYTYFPQAEVGCRPGEESRYQRPCRGSCEAYMRECKVECCDDSAQCVFAQPLGGSGDLVQSGYVDQPGPSAQCTGSNGRQTAPLSLALLLGILGLHLASNLDGGSVTSTQNSKIQKARGAARPAGRWVFAGFLAACILQGAQASVLDVPLHKTANWRSKADYLVENVVVEPGKDQASGQLNSCNIPDLSPTLQCSGHGYCKEWRSHNVAQKPTSFCLCERDWAGPECRTRRKSQRKAFLLTLFSGFLGADYFYLGFPLLGLAKLGTLGGAGLWWLLDIIRIGSGPVYADNYRVAADLTTIDWVFVLGTTSAFMLGGLLIALDSCLRSRKQKQMNEAMTLLRNYEEFYGPQFHSMGQSRPGDNRPLLAGYGTLGPA